MLNRNKVKFTPIISITPRKKLIQYQNVIRFKPYKLLINKPETINIDTVYD